ncbi:MAG: PQQ-like beta-propeller repeat protein [Bacteroidia bacterium]|nr:PQQ-like beta-propeller repeat protein [Bacteroidia bacterium]
MKKSFKIILITVAFVLVIAGYFGYQIYNMIMGSEPLTGKQDNIPAKIAAIPPITKGIADWSNWRGADFEGKSATKGIQTDWSKSLEKLWKVNYLCQDKSTASWSTPVVQGNRLIVPGRDINNDLVFCLNADNGELIWSGSYEAKAETAHGPGSRATPFINEDRVYTFGRSGDLVCWQLEDGKLLWRNNVKDVGGVEPSWGFSTTPLVFGNMVIVQGGGNALVIAYDKVTGELLWKSMEGEVGYAASITMNIENEVKLLIYHAKGLSCLNPSDGKVLWTVPWPTEYGVNATTPIVYNDIIFHTSGYKMGCEALKVTKSGYSVLWKNNVMEAQHSDPILIDGYIYGYSGESARNVGQFKCLELSTGKEMWSTDLIGQGTTTFADGYLICQDLKGNLFLIKPDPSGFKKVGEMMSALVEVKNPAWTVPIIANGKLYLRYMQQLVCYKLNYIL